MAVVGTVEDVVRDHVGNDLLCPEGFAARDHAAPEGLLNVRFAFASPVMIYADRMLDVSLVARAVSVQLTPKLWYRKEVTVCANL